MYSTTDTAQALRLLRKYHVQYIYVGIAERGEPGPNPVSNCFVYGTPTQPTCTGYPPAGLAKFDQMVRAGSLSVAYKNSGVTIYRVKG
jgi:hypothetical protein